MAFSLLDLAITFSFPPLGPSILKPNLVVFFLKKKSIILAEEHSVKQILTLKFSCQKGKPSQYKTKAKEFLFIRTGFTGFALSCILIGGMVCPRGNVT